MDKLGMTLQNFLITFSATISLQSIVYLAVQILKRLQFLHQLGFVYNNLNGSNIFVGRQMF